MLTAPKKGMLKVIVRLFQNFSALGWVFLDAFEQNILPTESPEYPPPLARTSITFPHAEFNTCTNCIGLCIT